MLLGGGLSLEEVEKVRVTIRCNQCGEKFILRGKMIKGKLQTGFKKCICNNQNDLEITTQAVS